MIVAHVADAGGAPGARRGGSTSSSTTSRNRFLLVLVVLILLAGVLGWVFNFVRQAISARVVGDVVLALREDAFGAVLERDMSFYDEFPSGKIVSRVTSDTEDFANVVTLTLNLLSQVLLVGFITALLFARDVGLALLTLADRAGRHRARARVPAGRPRHHPARAALARPGQRERPGDDGRHRGRQELPPGAAHLRRVPADQPADLPGHRCARASSSAASSRCCSSSPGSATVLLVLIGGRAGASAASVSPGDWYLFLQAVALFWFPLTSIASFWSQFQQGLSAARARLRADRRRAAGRADRHRSRSARLAGRIEFRDVTFGYDPDTAGPGRLRADDPRPARRSRWSGTPARASRPSAS